MHLHSNFDEIVKRKGIMKSFIAKEIGVSKTTLSLWSNDKDGVAKTSPNIFLVLKVAQLLNCTADELFEIKDDN
ncbi:helix-turn-helix domain-containing protein [Bacillus weihaiensis]|uniref:helix-turn-helix domain-containing protein n=1 Tax=Bacillus weihaiensis TaxID=1547283 RepID=UPI002355AAF9|nr:helix-turn-helix transcriptional regulator [Bacillus weihaiensis]